MTSLTGKFPKDFYKDLLQVSNNNAGIDATLRPFQDGEGTESALQVSTTAARATGPLDFTGTTHAGIRLNNLTTVQRDALTPQKGMAIFNTTTNRQESYNGTAWVDNTAGSITTLTGDAEAGANGIVTVKKINGQTPAAVATSGSYIDLSNKPTLFSGSYTDLTSRPTLASVATSGAYNDLTGKPTLAAVAASGNYSDLNGKPTIFSGSYDDLTNKPGLFSGAYNDLSGKPTLFSGNYTDLTGTPSISSQLTGLATAKQFGASDYFFYSQGGVAKQMPFNTFSAGTGVCVSWFGDPTGVDDTTTIQAAFTAAVNGSRKLIFDDPTGNGTQWYISSLIQDVTGKLSCARGVSFDSTTGVLTFDRNHGLKSGDVISFVGSSAGTGTGTAKVLAYTEYFVNVQSATSVKVYATLANALSGGTTGLYIPNADITSQATFNALTLTADLTNGSTTLTVADASKLIVGDTIYLNTTPASPNLYPKVASIAGNVITLAAAYSGATIPSGTAVFPSSVDMVSTLALEQGSTLFFNNPQTNNGSFGSFVVTSIVGNTVHLQQPPTNTFPTAGTAQTAVQGFWIDPKQQNLKFEMQGMPGVIVRKIQTSNAFAMFQFAWAEAITIRNLEIWGKSIGYRADPGIVNGDDIFRFFGCNKVLVDNCVMKYAGDSAVRCHSSSYYVAARSVSFLNAGTYSNNIIVQNSYFYDCFQLSTTNTSNYYMGGSHNVWFTNNIFEKIGGAVKFATRSPGSSNIYIVGNVVEGSGRHGFELDSYTNYQFHHNTISNCVKYGFFLIANNLQLIGFEFNEANFSNNIIKGGPDTGITSSSGGIYVSTDAYPDGTQWDYRGLQFKDNSIYDMPGASVPINIATGSFRGMRIERNTIENCATTVRLIAITLRPSSDANFEANIVLAGNIARKCTGTKATMFYIVATTAVAGSYIRGIQCSGNQFNNMDVTLGSNASNDGRFFHGDYLQDVRIFDNRWAGYGGNGVYIQSEGKDVSVFDNDFVNLNTATGVIVQMNNVDGIFVHSNKVGHNNASSNWFALDRRCQNVRFGPNDLTRTVSTRRGLTVGNVPYKTAENNYITRQDYVTSAPSAGTYDAGDRYLFAAPAANTSQGGICTTGGTYTAITATGDSTTGSNVISNISSMTNIARGMYLTHSGFTGTLKVLDMGTNSVTVTTAAGAATTATSTTTASALTVSAPVFKAMPSIAA